MIFALKIQGSTLYKNSLFCGDRLHLVLDHSDQELPPLIEYLQTSQIEIYNHRAIPFTLEDSFIGTVQRAETKS